MMDKNHQNRSILNPDGDDGDIDWRFRGGSTSREVVLGRLKAFGAGRSQAGSVSAVKSCERRYAILRVGKIKTMGHLAAAADHLSRDRETPNADLSRQSDNQLLFGPEGAEAVQDAWKARAPEKIRKNAVHALEYVITASPDAMRAMSPQDQSAYFDEALAFIEARHGSENVLTAVVHRDEMTPHLQALVIPIDERGKLNAREFVGGKQNLREMQTDFAELVADRFGLERGLERSQAQHQTIQHYYAKADLTVEPDFSPPERDKGLFRTEPAESYIKRLTGAYNASYGDAVTHYDQRIADLRGQKAAMLGKIDQIEALEAELDEVRTQNAEMSQEVQLGQKAYRAVESLGLMQGVLDEVRRLDAVELGQELQDLASQVDIHDMKSERAHELGRAIGQTARKLLSKEEMEALEKGQSGALFKAIEDQLLRIDVTRQYLETAALDQNNPEFEKVASDLLGPRADISGRRTLAASRKLALEKGYDLGEDDDMGM